MQKPMLVNNTGADLREFNPVFFDCIETGAALPEELADIFSLHVITVDGQQRGILNFA